MRTLLIAGLLTWTLAGETLAQQTPPTPPPVEEMGSSPADGGPGAGRGGGMRMLRMADTNGDGVITRDEYVAAVGARFDRMDANHDGIVQAGERPAPRGGMMMGGDTPPTGAPGSAPRHPPRPGRDLTKAEYRERAMRVFDRLDINHDGKIDQSEMQAAATMMQFRGAGRRGRPGGMNPPPAPPAQ